MNDIRYDDFYRLLESKYNAYISKSEKNFLIVKLKEEYVELIKDKITNASKISSAGIRMFKLGSEQQTGIYKIYHKINSEIDMKKIIEIFGDSN